MAEDILNSYVSNVYTDMKKEKSLIISKHANSMYC